ncbi:DUF5789 family protein [Haloferacaceae archaeon DSL9]
MSEPDDSRELGVEFGDLDDELEAHDYPATVDELVDEYGDYELELPGGEETFGEALGPYQEDPDEEFHDADEVRQAVLNMVGSEAVGRERYSDRGEDPDEDAESF